MLRLKVMSASTSMEEYSASQKSKTVNNCIKSRYALYLISSKKHTLASESIETKEKLKNAVNEVNLAENQEPKFCLSLLEGNLGGDLETVVRCYLLKSVPACAPSDFPVQSDGKYTVLQSSDADNERFGCYYHRLTKHVEPSCEKEKSPEENLSKAHIFFICLIGPSNGIMESFCQELGAFCCSLTPLLDPEGLKNQDDMQLKLKSWYYYCIEYVSRCVKKFKDGLAQVLHCSLWGNVKIITSDAEVKWDLERLVDVCSLMPKVTSDQIDSLHDIDQILSIEIKDQKFVIGKEIGNSQYCMRWYEKLKNCYIEDHPGLHSILESFRLKSTQDLNTSKRLIQKAVTDYYAFFRAYQFLQNSGYENVLLHHVKREATLAKENDIVEIVDSLKEYIDSKEGEETEE